MREQRVLLAVALNPLAFHSEATPVERHTLRCLRRRGWVAFHGERSAVSVLDAGWATLPERAHALIRLGAGR
jgi:hypothetical protein